MRQLDLQCLAADQALDQDAASAEFLTGYEARIVALERRNIIRPPSTPQILYGA